MQTISFSELKNKLGAFKKQRRDGIGRAHYILEFANGKALQSYTSIVAIKINDEQWIFTTYHDYSITTNRHMWPFCGFGAVERRKMLATNSAYYYEGNCDVLLFTNN